MSRLFILIIGFIAGWFLKDSNWEEWLEKIKSYFEPQQTPADPIPLLEENKAKATPAKMGEAFSDPLEKLTGIGPAAKKKLNDNGIYTFAQVAVLEPEKFKEIVGARVKVEKVIKHAKELAG